jgi:hypothetical protein
MMHATTEKTKNKIHTMMHATTEKKRGHPKPNNSLLIKSRDTNSKKTTAKSYNYRGFHSPWHYISTVI